MDRMKESSIKEDLSIAYMSAICAAAGIAFDLQRHDDDSTDAIIKKLIVLSEARKCEVSLRVQLKATSSPSQYKEDNEKLTYVLKTKNYNDLRTASTTPIILAVLILPEDESDWLKWTKEELMIKGRMFWRNFQSSSETENKNTISVMIPKENYLNPDTLLKLLQKMAEEV
ncbi:MAG: DUF4365 domain-containing protein [Lachnospiraceae bacterium]|nr:DUF4365 domain-containing protein [Lachnospiraceae bacterium]